MYGVMALEGFTALVTGGGRGIGRAVALRLAREGARVVVSGRTAAEIDEVASLTAGASIVWDLSNRDALERGLAALRARFPVIHVLVNNAGVAESAPFDRTSDELWDRALALNVTAPFALCRALIPAMIEAGFGRVINVASNAGLTGYAYTSAYAASKHALVGITRSIALEIARTPVTINAVCPGWVDTEMTREAVARIAEKTGKTEGDARKALEAMSPQRRMVDPAEVAHVVAMLCAPEARSIHGQAIAIDGGQVMT
jgi:NAD(P)-dependent dehydrogenase (short-subunit alcohol dehydrogenase family)